MKRRRQPCECKSVLAGPCLIVLRLPAKPEHTNDNFITLHFASWQSGKAALASVANGILHTKMRETPRSESACDIDEPSVSDLKLALEGWLFGLN